MDGVYDIYVDADGYNPFYMSEAFEIAGNTVNFDVELFEYGYAGPPHMLNLHDVPNDQGRNIYLFFNKSFFDNDSLKFILFSFIKFLSILS